MKVIIAVALLALTFCTPQPVAPKPDSSDASAFGETSGPPLSPCAQACADMLKAGCIVMANCPLVLQENTTAGRIRNAKTGKFLECPDLVGVKTAADVQALGQQCGP